MRNLVQLSAKTYLAPSDHVIQSICHSSDDSDFLYSCSIQSASTSTSHNHDADDEEQDVISIHLIRTCPNGEPSTSPTSTCTLLANLRTVKHGSIYPPSSKAHPPLILSFQLLSDSGEILNNKPALSIITSTGEIALLPLDNCLKRVDQEYATEQRLDYPDQQVPEPTIVGSVQDGILDAKWSPDNELLVLVVPDNDAQDDDESQQEQSRQGIKRLKTILMNLDFDVVNEGPLQVDEFGQDAPVDVGWGSKATQFHGSEGKAAAAAAAAAASKQSSSGTGSGANNKPAKNPRGTITKDDDLLPRISWRNDGSFYFVSSLDQYLPGTSTGSATQDKIQELDTDEQDTSAVGGRKNINKNENVSNRIIRVFNRNGDLSCSSEEIKGLSHVLNVRPIGNIVASSQRFGSGKRAPRSIKSRNIQGQEQHDPTAKEEEEEFDWGKGRLTRHDIIFFERNGLRHGEFSLREEENELIPPSNTSASTNSPIDATTSTITDKRQIDHEIKELKWNSDGNALGIWIRRLYNDGAEKDFVQIWTTMNYHWYLKAELSIPDTSTSIIRSTSSPVLRPSSIPTSSLPSPSSSSSPSPSSSSSPSPSASSEYQSLLQSFSFHPTLPFSISLLTATRIFTFNHHLSTISSGFNSSKPCVNGVLDGKEIKIYPFDLSNTPPPFAPMSLRLNLNQSENVNGDEVGDQLERGGEMMPRNVAWGDVHVCRSKLSHTHVSTIEGKGKVEVDSIEESKSILATLGERRVNLFLSNWGTLDQSHSNLTNSISEENKVGKLDKVKGPFLVGSFEIPTDSAFDCFNPRQIAIEVEELQKDEDRDVENRGILKVAILGNGYFKDERGKLMEEDYLRILIFDINLDINTNTSIDSAPKSLNLKSKSRSVFYLGEASEKKLISRRMKTSPFNSMDDQLIFLISGSKGRLWSFKQQKRSTSSDLEFTFEMSFPTSLPNFCPNVEIVPDFGFQDSREEKNEKGRKSIDTDLDSKEEKIGSRDRIVGLSSNGILYLSFGQRLSGRRNQSSAPSQDSFRILAKDATSFLISGNFLIWTDISHLGNFLSLSSLFSSATSSISNPSKPLAIEQTKLVRNLERGSFLISSVPSSMTLILQMPRGNLETIYPRPLVLEVVKDQLDKRRYGNAVRICRTHRIDLNLVVDYDRRGKGRTGMNMDGNTNANGQGTGLLGYGDEKEIRKFVRGVREVDHLNLFLSSLRNEDVTKTMYKFVPGFYSAEEQQQITNSKNQDSQKREGDEFENGTSVATTSISTSSTSYLPSHLLPERSRNSSSASQDSFSLSNKVNRICDALRKELQRVDTIKYLNSILTTYVRKTPPDYESALSLLLNLKNSNQISVSLIETSITYMIFLSDGDELFKVSLGMYDFTTTLLIAQNSKKKDPREYLPFLRGLKELQPIEWQRFKIDDWLERREKAFQWLAKGCQNDTAVDDDGEKLEFAMSYLEKYGLWRLGLVEWKGDRAKVERVRDSFGEHLLTKRKPEEAAVAFTLANKPRKALKAYLEASLWQEALTLAKPEKFPQSELIKIARNVSETLEGLSKFSDAGQVLYEYCPGDLEDSIRLFCKANEFAKVKRICHKSNREDLLETHLRNSLSESGGILIDDIQEMREQLIKQLDRIKELKIKKEENPNGFYLDEDPALENLDVMSDTSTQITQFTRYTAATSGAASLLSSSSGGSTAFQTRKKAKKDAKKKLQGRKGSVWEEGYLYDSLQKLLKEKLHQVQTETSRILPHLVTASTTHRKLAQALQDSLSAFESLALAGVENLWRTTQEEEHNRIVAIFEEQRLQQEQQNLSKGQIPDLNSSSAPLGSLTILQVNALCAARDRAARPKMEVALVDWKLRALDTLNIA